MQFARELPRAHRMSLTAVVLQVGAFFVKRTSDDYAMNAGHSAVRSCGLPVVSRGRLLYFPAGLCPLVSTTRLVFAAFPTARSTVRGCCGRR